MNTHKQGARSNESECRRQPNCNEGGRWKKVVNKPKKKKKT